MKQALKIQSVNQWFLLKQINDKGILREKKIPEEVMRVILHILQSKTLGKDGFLVLCLEKVRDDYIEIEEIADIYPYHLWLEDEINEILVKTRHGIIKSWYITHAKIKGQNTKVKVVYTVYNPL